jgi:hypothetical protein
LRLWGIGFGLPELFHPDEPAYVLQALAVGRGLPDGLTFANPPLHKYILVGEYAAVYGVERLAGATTSPQDFIAQFRADPSLLYLIARATSAVVGAATALAALALGAAVHGRRVGLIAAWLTGLSYLLVRDSHFGVNDALVTLLVTSALVFCVRIARGGARADYLLAGGLAGLAFATKYHGIAVLGPLVLAHVLRPGGRRRIRDLLLGLGMCLAAGIIAFPSLLTETGRVLHDVYVHLYVSATSGYDGLDPSGGYVYYARALLVGLGWPLLLATLLGLVLGIAVRGRRTPGVLVLGVLPVGLIVVLGGQQLFFARFLLPILPALLVEAALALDSLIALQPVLGLIAALLVAAPTLVDSLRFDTLLTRADTRSRARSWVYENLPADGAIAVDSAPLGPTIAPDGRQVLVANDWSLFDMSVADYRARGITYLIQSSFTSDAPLIDPVREARRRAFYATLPGEAQVLAVFRPSSGSASLPFVYDQIYAPFDGLDTLERPGPTIAVYLLNAGAAAVGRDTPP